ncbi:hypothetical protein NDU88_009394 [Pleurodeles waltl]|uniref:Uncharacterized protein n=1 Tax=Pleurodeles waltl TaxID=8319 RepID=A0AAV7QXE2_PLEWA|nr:hypothetical protein NDU88_009394 [Pleurodeles waltl]
MVQGRCCRASIAAYNQERVGDFEGRPKAGVSIGRVHEAACWGRGKGFAVESAVSHDPRQGGYGVGVLAPVVGAHKDEDAGSVVAAGDVSAADWWLGSMLEERHRGVPAKTAAHTVFNDRMVIIELDEDKGKGQEGTWSRDEEGYFEEGEIVEEEAVAPLVTTLSFEDGRTVNTRRSVGVFQKGPEASPEKKLCGRSQHRHFLSLNSWAAKQMESRHFGWQLGLDGARMVVGGKWYAMG